MGIRKHQASLTRISETAEKPAAEQTYLNRPSERIYGSGGVLEKITRKIYQDGLKNLKNRTFQNKAAQKEWEEFRDGLSPDTLKMVLDEDWE